ncbi:uncharacterized protein VTP21DRAFT_3292 [Calcarisporiella thermophila]|uniref:uncharacterized protein n=1 Tax=Calcarisporiella thermophila TaxID=911321 RepID=UPI0037428BCA
MTEKRYYSYDQIHRLIKESVEKHDLREGWKPDVILAIGGGGFIPARILRTFLKRPDNRSVPIQAVGLRLYEELESGESRMGDKVVRTQWLHFGEGEEEAAAAALVGKRILIVDEVDDTRTTLAYAVLELQKDLERLARLRGLEGFGGTKIGVFVVHNKLKPKRAELPVEVDYFSAEDVKDAWCVYPWDVEDIEEHTRIANEKVRGVESATN